MPETSELTMTVQFCFSVGFLTDVALCASLHRLPTDGIFLYSFQVCSDSFHPFLFVHLTQMWCFVNLGGWV